jgi:hypothetical protein
MNGLNMVGVLQKKSKTFDEIKSREYKLILADSSAKLVDSARGGHEAEIPSEITVGDTTTAGRDASTRRQQDSVGRPAEEVPNDMTFRV